MDRTANDEALQNEHTEMRELLEETTGLLAKVHEHYYDPDRQAFRVKELYDKIVKALKAIEPL